jgi:hypothetical protein
MLISNYRRNIYLKCFKLKFMMSNYYPPYISLQISIFFCTSELVQFCVTPVLRYEGRSLSDFLDLEEDRRRKNKCCRFR